MTRINRITLQGFKSFADKVSIPFPHGFTVICGPNGAGKCLDYDSLVFLSSGDEIKIGKIVEEQIKKSKRIKKMEDGIYVPNEDEIAVLSFDHNLKIVKRKVKNFIKRKAPKEMFKITTASGREIIATEYHPLFTITKNGIVSLDIDKLKKGMKIATPRKLLVELKDTRDLYAPYSKEIRSGVKAGVLESIMSHEDFSKKLRLTKFSLKNLMNKQYMGSVAFKKISNNWDATKYIKSDSKPIKLPYYLIKEISRFLGYLISEKGSTTNNKWFIDADNSIAYDFGDITKKEFGIDINLFGYTSDAKDVIISSKPMELILQNLFDISIDSLPSDKRILNMIMKANDDIISEFLAGLFDGDAYLHFDKCNNKKHIYFEYSTASEKLARGIQTLLLRLGLISILKKKTKYLANTKTRRKRTYYSLLLYGNDVNKLVEKVEFRDKRKREIAEKIKSIKTMQDHSIDLIPNISHLVKLLIKEACLNVKELKKVCSKLQVYYENSCEYSRDELKEIIEITKNFGKKTNAAKCIIKQLESLSNSDIFWDKIISIEKINYNRKWVYDLEIEGTHNFVANNIFVHNSNICDAIMFALGISSAKIIRAEKLLNLIFHGTKKRGPAKYCTVSLYLDNKDKKLPYDEEIKITRKVNDKGLSIIRLNGKVVTRSKVLDLLSNLNISPYGHNIIMQGDINKIIEMSSIERREIIDQISGIAEFDEKRAKAEGELEKVEKHIREMSIILTEKEKLTEKLRLEKESAEKSIALNNEIKKIRYSLVNANLTKLQKSVDKLNEKIAENTKLFEVLNSQFLEKQSELENKDRMTKKISDTIIQKARNIELLRKIDKINMEIIRKKDKMEMNERVLSREYSDYVSKSVLGQKGVIGTIAQLIEIPADYSIAIRTAIGTHMNDIVVENEDIAIACIKFLKERKIGMARFLPLNKIRYKRYTITDKENIIDLAVNLIRFDSKYANVINYVLGNTAVISDIEKIKKMHEPMRAVTLSGDLVEMSGAIFGGYYKKAEFENRLRKENEILEKEIKELEAELNKLKEIERVEEENMKKMEEEKTETEKSIENLRKEVELLYNKRLTLQNEISKLRIEHAKKEAELENLKNEAENFKTDSYYDYEVSKLRIMLNECLKKIEELGPINMKADEEYKIVSVEFNELKKRLEKLTNEKNAILNTISEIEKKRYNKFMETLNTVSSNFYTVYKDLMNGEARLRLEEEGNINSGLIIEATTETKKILNIDAMSGGEKTMTALAFLFAIQQYHASPFYILDEVDATLDKVNLKKAIEFIKKYSEKTQFIIITHNDLTIKEADNVFGVSMENGVSKIFSIKMPKV